MVNREIQTKYFLKGTVAFYGAICLILVAQYLTKNYLKDSYSIFLFSGIEFFMLMMCGIFYVFCPRYYKYQWLIILSGFILYFLFRKLF